MTDPSPPARRPWRTVAAAAGALLVALLVAQAVRWRIDPPMWLPNGIYPRDLYVEGAFKAHESRRWALLGTWVTDPDDQYRFWKVQSPLHAWPLALWLKAVGVSWSSLRAYSVATFAAGWLALFGAAVRWRRDGVAVLLAVAILGDFYLRYVARSALLEVPLTAWAAWTMIVLVAAARDPRWAIGLPWLAAGAFLTKQSGVVVGATALALGPWLMRRHRHHPALRSAVARTLGGTVLVGIGLGLLVSSDDYWRTLEWNANHMLGQDNNRARPLTLDYLDPRPVLDRLADPGRWRAMVAWYLPVALPLALVQWVAMLRDAWRRRPLAADDVVVTVSWLVSLALLQLSHQIRLRFSLILFPPTWWLAGRGAIRLWRIGGRVRWAMVGAVAVGLLASHGAWHLRHLGSDATTLFDGNDALADTLTREDRLVGKAAPWMAFSTRADHFVVRWPFNCSADRLRSIAPTHVLRDTLTRREYTRVCLRRVRRDWSEGNEELARITWAGRPMVLEAWSADGP